MPPRIVVAMIVVFWLFSFGWLIEREWLPWVSWLHADSPPPFSVEIADEAAPMPAHWSIRQGDKPIGNATTHMFCRKDGSIELQSTVENLELLKLIKVTRLTTNQKVTRDGQLVSINSDIQLHSAIPGQEFAAHAHLEGAAKDGKLFLRGRLESSFGDFDQELDPFPLESGSMMNPLQPVAKLHVRPGQRWKITNVDPLPQAVKIIAKKYPILERLSGLAGPSVFMAHVRSEPENLMYRGESISCYVVDYRSKSVTGSTWAQVSDGKVLRQEVTGMGDITLTLVRDD